MALSADRTQLTPPWLSSNSGPVTFVVGAERDGLAADVIAAADAVARIPIHIHSLNAAMAATIALYEATRMAAG